MDSKNRTRVIIFTIVFIALSVVHIFVGMDSDNVWLNAGTKAAPILLLMVGVICSGNKVPLVVCALIFSMLGDVVAELKIGQQAFLLQIAFFAVAQVFYILAFTFYHSHKSSPAIKDKALSLAPIFCVVYALFVIGMALSACLQHSRHRAVYITGAILFVISDSLILVNMLAGPAFLISVAVMATYYIAQYLLNICLIEERKIIG